jgi:hypothetical protein
MTPTSVVPPPMSTTMEPDASDTGSPAPMAAAMGSSIRYTSEAPAPRADSRMARRSTWVRAAGHADDDARAGAQDAARVHHLDELLEHLLGDREVGDDAVLHGPDGFDVAGHLAQHGLGFLAHGLDGLLALRATFVANGNHRGLVQNDALATHVNQRVGGAQVNGQVGGEITAQRSGKHGWRCGQLRASAAFNSRAGRRQAVWGTGG